MVKFFTNETILTTNHFLWGLFLQSHDVVILMKSY